MSLSNSTFQSASTSRSNQPGLSGTCQALIIDMSNVVCRYWHHYKHNGNETVRHSIQNVCDHIRRFQPKVVIIACEGGHAARREIYPQYKAHRKEKDDDLVQQLKLFTKACQAIGWPCPRSVGHEADDVIALIAQSYANRKMQVVICTTDKDLKRLIAKPNIHVCDHQGTMTTPEDVMATYGVRAEQLEDYLALMGDVGDGIPGVARIGEKTAAALIHKHSNINVVLEAAKHPGTDKALQHVAKGLDDLLLSQKLIAFFPCNPECTQWGKSKTWPQWPIEGYETALINLGVSSLCQTIKDASESRLLVPF